MLAWHEMGVGVAALMAGMVVVEMAFADLLLLFPRQELGLQREYKLGEDPLRALARSTFVLHGRVICDWEMLVVARVMTWMGLELRRVEIGRAHV